MKTIKTTLGERVKMLREHYRKSQSEFASAIGFKSYQGVSKIENGTSEPQDATIEKMSKQYGTTREWLLQGTGAMLPNGMVEMEAETSEQSSPWRDEALTNLKAEVKFYRDLLMQMTGSKNFLTAPSKTDLRLLKTSGY